MSASKGITFIGHYVKIRFRNSEGKTQTAWLYHKPTCFPEEKKECQNILLDEQPILNQFHPCHLTYKYLLYHSFHHLHFLTMTGIYHSLRNNPRYIYHKNTTCTWLRLRLTGPMNSHRSECVPLYSAAVINPGHWNAIVTDTVAPLCIGHMVFMC